jgi:bacterioferritin
MAKMSREKRKQKVIEVLNTARSMELFAIHQYMNQHYNLDDMDYGQLAGNLKLIAIDEMRHSEMFAERIKELGGEPTAEPDGIVKKGQKIGSIFVFDAGLENNTIDIYNFESIIDDEQLHFNYFDNVRDHIEKLGDTYLANIAGSPSTTGLQPSGFAVAKGG